MSYEKEYVMFLVGRMNPPTPGHIRGLCVPFLRVLREKCLEILELPGDSEVQLVELARQASIAPRLFLTNSTNEKRISYLSGAKAALYDNVQRIVKEKTTTAQMQDGLFYVKDKQLENPLDPDQKKLYVVEMLGNELALPENQDIMVPKAILNNWIVCQTIGNESWCASFGPASAIKCALMLSKPKKYDKVFFFMGVDEDPSEMARRSKFCQDSETENDEGAKVKCVKLERINTATLEDAEPAIASAEAIADGSMSASKIRLLCANGHIQTLQRLYKGLLTPRNVIALANAVRIGLRLDRMVEDIDPDLIDAAPSPPSRRSGRLSGSMAGPGLVDSTYESRRSGWMDLQRTQGRNAIGLSGVQSVRNAERMAKQSQLYSIPETEEKEGGRRRKTRRYRKRSGKKSCTKKKRKNNKTALLCIDMQNFPPTTTRDGVDFSAEDIKSYPDRLETVKRNAEKAQKHARSKCMEVIFCRIKSKTKDGRDRSGLHKKMGIHVLPHGDKRAQFLRGIGPEDDEMIFNKTGSNAFETTNLNYVLRNVGIKKLYIMGLLTDECVAGTVKSAADLGYDCTVLEDACTAATQKIHEASILGLRRFAKIEKVSKFVGHKSKRRPKRKLKRKTAHKKSKRGKKKNARRTRRR